MKISAIRSVDVPVQVQKILRHEQIGTTLRYGKSKQCENVEGLPFIVTKNSKEAWKEQAITMLMLDLKRAEERTDVEGYIKESTNYESFDLPILENVLDILNYCWFVSLYVNMLSDDDEISYCVEGEGDWGDLIGFVISNGKLIYLGAEYFDYMKEE